MRHRKLSKRLSLSTAHRQALISNMVKSLIQYERITTTLPRAKVIATWAERMITLAKRQDLWSQRQAVAFLTDRELVKKLFREIGPRFKDRQGGYTRVIRLDRRPGDRAYTAILEWVSRPAPAPEVAPEEAKKTKGKKLLAESKA